MAGLLLAMDLSTNCGWALFERTIPPSAPRFGTERLPPGDHGRRFAHLFNWLNEAHSVMGFDALAFEKPILPRKSGDLATTEDTMILLWGLAANVRLFAALRGMRCEPVGVQECKLALTNKQHATKEEMVIAAMKVWKWPVSDDHQADAGAVGLVAYGRIWPRPVAA